MGLEIVELVMGIEEAFDLEIPDRDVEPLVTVGLMYEYLLKRLDHAGRLRLPNDLPESSADWTPETVWNRLRETIAEQEKIPVESIVAATHFIGDLGFG